MSELDFLDPATFDEGIPHAAYRRLRDEAPVSWHARPDGGYWLLTRHADVHQALVDATHFSSWLGTTTLHEAPPEHIPVMRMMLLNMDPPDHTRYRRLISRAFAARAVEKLEPRIRQIVGSLLGQLAPRGRCDFVGDVACPLPMQVILELIGAPLSDAARLLELSDRMMSPDEPEHGGADGAIAASLEMYGYGFALATERRANPRDDLMSYLIQAEVDGERLNDGEINAFFLLLVVAGNETIRNLLSGGLQLLFDHPEQRARLEDRALLPTAIEEMLRVTSPIKQWRRTAAREIELHGRTIREGDKVILAHVSANHDERIFTDPTRFDVGRAPNAHIAFGVGPHLCLGAALARVEARVLFDDLLRRLPDLSPDGAGRRLRSNMVNGWRSLPVTFSPRVGAPHGAS